MIEFKASIEKADGAILGKLKGLGNAKTLTLDGREYGPGTLVFVGFVGAKNHDTGKWDGVLRFEEGKAKDAHAFDPSKYKPETAKRSTKSPAPAKGLKP